MELLEPLPHMGWRKCLRGVAFLSIRHFRGGFCVLSEFAVRFESTKTSQTRRPVDPGSQLVPRVWFSPFCLLCLYSLPHFSDGRIEAWGQGGGGWARTDRSSGFLVIIFPTAFTHSSPQPGSPGASQVPGPSWRQTAGETRRVLAIHSPEVWGCDRGTPGSNGGRGGSKWLLARIREGPFKLGLEAYTGVYQGE